MLCCVERSEKARHLLEALEHPRLRREPDRLGLELGLQQGERDDLEALLPLAIDHDDGELTATVPMSHVPRTSTYTRGYADEPGFLTLISDGRRLTGAYALGPEAGEWLQQATVAIRARVPIEVMRDVIQPFPTFSESFLYALTELGARMPVAA